METTIRINDIELVIEYTLGDTIEDLEITGITTVSGDDIYPLVIDKYKDEICIAVDKIARDEEPNGWMFGDGDREGSCY